MDTKTNRKMVDSGVEWIGEVPEGWTVDRLCDHFYHSKELNRGMKEKNRLALTMAGVIPRSIEDDTGLQTSDFEGYQIFEKNDLAFKLIDLQNIKTSRVGRVPERGIMSPAYIRVRPRQGACTDFYYYQLYSAYTLNVFNDMGGGVRQTVSRGELMEFKVISPPLPLQQAIANYLDHHVGLIDEERDLISKKIEFLKEKRSALIFEVVTGKRTLVEAQHLAGVDDRSDIVGSGELMAVPTPRADDPFAKSGRLVDSGVEWIGEIPSEWRVEKLSGLVQETSNKNRGMKENNLLSLSYGRIVRKDIESNQGLLPQSFEGYNIVSPGDVVLRLTDLQNDQRSLRTALVTERGIITSAYTTISAPAMEAKYFAYAMNACDSSKVFYRLGGGVRQSMRFQDIKQILIPIPDSFEQQAIADFLDLETGLIDKEINLLTQKNELLSEQRKALIFEAVTGKIEITE